MPVTIPHVFTGGVGQKAKASEVNANFATLAAMFTDGPGGIKDGDVSTGADLNANKLSGTPGKRISEAKFEDNAVSARVLADDPTAGAPNAAVASPQHIKNSVVTREKLKLRVTAVSLGQSSFPSGGDVTQQVADNYNSTTEQPIAVYLKAGEAAAPSGGDSTQILMGWEIRPIAGSTYACRFTFRYLGSGTLTYASTPQVMFVYLQD